MKQEEKAKLEQQSKRKYWGIRFFLGCKALIAKKMNWLILLAYALLLAFIWINSKTIISYEENSLLSALTLYLFQLAFVLWTMVSLFFLIAIIGTPKGQKSTEDNLKRIGFINHAGETPFLIGKIQDKENENVIVLEFEINGLPLPDWEEKRDKIESALNLHIVRIMEGKNKRRILLHTVSAACSLSDSIYWEDEYLSKVNFILVLGESLIGKVTVNLSTIPHILLGGSTGSGKSVLLKLLLMQCLKKNAIVYIADFKGGVDFPSIWHEQCRLIIDESELLECLTEIVNELESRKEMLRSGGYANIDEYNEKSGFTAQRIIFACDEIAEVLDKNGLSKDKKELVQKIENKLSVIARQGRAFGIHLILATQRPDATILSGQIRNNINCRICGRADNVLSQIILDNGDAHDKIPKQAQGRFLMHDGTVFQSYLFDERDILR